MSGGFFRGTSADQDTRFSNKQAKLLKTHKFPSELDQLVDMSKVKMDVMRPWIATRVTELLGFEDEVLINFIYGLLEGKGVDGKQIQIQITGFMEKNTSKFMKELWILLMSAQKNASGVPQQFLDAKEEEIKKKKVESDRIMEEIQKKREKDKIEEELEKKNKRITDDKEDQRDKDNSKRTITHGSPSRNRHRRSPPRHRRRSRSRSRSRSPYRSRRYKSPDFAPRRSSPSRNRRYRSPPSRRRSPPPPRKRSESPYENRVVRDRKVISSKIQRLSAEVSPPARSESPDFVPRRSSPPPQRKRSMSPYERRSPPTRRSGQDDYRRKERRSPAQRKDSEKTMPIRDRKVVSTPNKRRRELSDSPDERDHDNASRRKTKESIPPNKSKQYDVEEPVYGPSSAKKLKGRPKDVSSESEHEAEKQRTKRKIKQKKYEKYSDESSESEYSSSESDREERKRRREKKKDEKRKRRHGDKHKRKHVRDEDEGDSMEEDESEKRAILENELREKALLSLRAKKVSTRD